MNLILKEKMENRDMNELWYEKVSYEDAKDLIKESLANTVSSFVTAGYWLKYIRDKRTYEKEGYSSLWEMAEKEFGLKESEASRAMSMNDKYSIDGNTPVMLEKYVGYNKSQLQEMLTMTEEQLEKATADMKVQELRQLKKTGATPEELEMLREVLIHYTGTAYADICKASMELGGEVSEIIKEKLERDVPVRFGNKVFFTGENKDELVEQITGEVLSTYSPDVAAGMILEEYLKLHEVRQIKRKPVIRGLCNDAYCGECGFGLKEPDSGLEVSRICLRCGQAVDWSGYGGKERVKEPGEPVNTESDSHLEEKSEPESVAMSQEPVNTESDTLFEAEIVEEIETEKEEIIEHLEFDLLEDGEGEEEIAILEGEFREIPAVEEVPAYVETMESENVPAAAVEEKEQKQVKKILEKEKELLNEYLKIEDLPEFTVKRQKIIVGALANMLCELENMEEVEVKEQPELTALKNDDQRKEFIDGYGNWPVWIEQPLTGERYYRYEFENGTAFVVRVYFHKCFDYNLRDVKWEDRYKDGWGAEEYYIVTEGKYFKDCLTNRSHMTEFLKNLQKNILIYMWQIEFVKLHTSNIQKVNTKKFNLLKR